MIPSGPATGVEGGTVAAGGAVAGTTGSGSACGRGRPSLASPQLCGCGESLDSSAPQFPHLPDGEDIGLTSRGSVRFIF